METVLLYVFSWLLAHSVTLNKATVIDPFDALFYILLFLLLLHFLLYAVGYATHTLPTFPFTNFIQDTP
jgi:hypothetical protein